jgi:hypothetical protein
MDTRNKWTGESDGEGESIHNIQHFKQPIKGASASVTAGGFGRAWQEMEYSLDVYTDTNGAHIELR